MNKFLSLRSKIYKTSTGFTLIELLITLAIVVVISVIGFLSLNNYRGEQVLENSLNQIAAAVRDTQNKAITQQNGKTWGVHFVNASSGGDYYQIFSGTSYATSAVAQTYYLPNNTQFGEPGSDLSVDEVFSALTGQLPMDKIISIVTGNKDGFVGDLIFHSQGLITTSDEHGLVGYWHFDEGVATTTYDASGMGGNGNLVSGTWLTGSNCIAGSCLSLNGTSDYVEVPSSVYLSPSSNSFSVEIWFKLNAVGTLNGSILYSKENLYEASAGGGYFSYAWQPYWAWASAFPVVTGQWYQAVVVYDGTNQYVYENGSLAYSRSQTGNMVTSNNALRFGARGAPGAPSAFFPGVIDEIKIYNRALSATEIMNQYNDLK